MIDDVSAQLRRGVVEYCVLGLLDREPMYGWQLSSALIEQELIASIGTLYPLLGRLRDRGFIETYEQRGAADEQAAAERGGPRRKYYRLTPHGQEQLERFRSSWGPFTATVNAIIAREEP